MGQDELTTISAYGRASSTSSVFSAVEKGNNARARAPYRIRHRGWFIAIMSTIFFMSVCHLGMGIFIAVVVDPHNVYYDHVVQETYSPGTLVSQVAVAFFWITVPAVMSILTLIELIQICRNREPAKWMVISSVAASMIWAMQLSLEFVCMYGTYYSDTLSTGGLCMWRYSTNDSWANWDAVIGLTYTISWLVIPVLCMYIIYFAVSVRAVVVDKRDLKEQNSPLVAPKADSLSLHTLSTSPVAETLLTDTHPSTRGVTRPPSYFSTGAASDDSYDVKKD